MSLSQIGSVEASPPGNRMDEVQNSAACYRAPSSGEESRSPASTNDAKRNEAARLARDLASASSWSDAFVPQSYGTRQTRQASIRTGVTPRQELEEMNNDQNPPDNESDPPPAYSNPPPVHELPATPLLTSAQPVAANPQQLESATTLAETEQGTERRQQEQDEQQPLLGRVHCRRRGWAWVRHGHPGKSLRYKCCKLLGLVTIFSIVAIVMMCVLAGGYVGGEPSNPSTTFVPTGPTYEQHETTDSISGAYKLYDRLDLSTTTGSIDVEIDPQPGDNPAVLLLCSDLGSVTLRLSSAYLRRRKRTQRALHTEIRSLTGSVTAQILLGDGGYALVDTATGPQELSVLVENVGPRDEISNLTTYSRTGGQNVAVVSLDRSVTNLRAEHHSFGTGALNIAYPPTWQGEVHALVSPFGRVSLQGDNLRYQQKDDHEVLARRGSALDKQRVNIVSDGTGSIKFTC